MHKAPDTTVNRTSSDGLSGRSGRHNGSLSAGHLPSAGAVGVQLASVLLSGIFWGWLKSESNASTIRNVALVVGGVVAGLLAMWRSMVAERQADTA